MKFLKWLFLNIQFKDTFKAYFWLHNIFFYTMVLSMLLSILNLHLCCFNGCSLVQLKK